MALAGLFILVPLLADFEPIGLVFLLVWESVALLNGPVRWLRGWRSNRTRRYASTDRRILETWDYRGPQSVSYELKALGPPQVVRGGIRMEWFNQPGSVLMLDPLTDPLIVRDRIAAAQAENRQ